MSSKPNIFLIISDHLSPNVIGAYGDTRGATPSIDAIAARGTAFSNAYTPCPLCQPARAAMWTGAYPHQTQVRSNGRRHENGPVPDNLPTIGDAFSSAGYECCHIGKRHDFGTLRGFSCTPEHEEKDSPTPPHPAWPEHYDTRRDNVTYERVLDFLQTPHTDPFFLVADLHNPHDICNWIGHNNSLEGDVENTAIPMELPPLPPNFNVADMHKRPIPVQYICCSHNRMAQASGWTEENYRHYIAAYTHYTQLADRMIGAFMEQLRQQGLADNTLVVVLADHGDGQGCHRMVTKQVSFYDETARVPFVIAGPGLPRQSADKTNALISLLDLFPTLCDYATIDLPSTLEGKSLLPLLRGDTDTHHTYVASEWHTEWGFTTSPGRMIRTPRFKYTRYLEGDGEELYDMVNDPHEMKTLHDDPAYAKVLDEHRAMLRSHIEKTGDDFDELHVDVDTRWREHDCGYPHHAGPSAPMLDPT